MPDGADGAGRCTGQRALPRDRQREEERVEPRVVEALADVAPGREQESFLVVRDRRELAASRAPRLGAHAALQHDEMAREVSKLAAKYSRWSLRSVSRIGERPSSSAE